VLARCEDDLAERNHSFLVDGFADHCKGLLPDLSLRNDVVGVIEIQLIDLGFGNERLDLNDALALECNRVELFGFELDVLALADLVAFDDVVGLDLAPSLCIHLLVLDPVAGLLVQLMEADLLALGRGREQRDRARDQRQLEIAFPIRAWGHEILHPRELRFNVVVGVMFLFLVCS
jgi:hypothetical protein